MHPSAENEWWYFTGHLSARKGQRFGFETTLFKLHHIHIPGSKRTVSVDRVDTALSDVTGHRFLHSVSYIEPFISPVKLSTSSFQEHMGSATVSGGAKGPISLRASTKGAQFRFTLRRTKPALLEGGGLVPMGRAGSSYYYSYTFLKIAGRVHYRGKWRSVHGIGWMDHQWGNWDWRNIHGWTWGALQLSDGTQFSIARFRAAGGGLHGASESLANGRQRTYKSVAIKPLGHWKSPTERTVYGSGWKISIPADNASFVVHPLLKNQEVYDPVEPRTTYWEGACSVRGTVRGKRVSGQAYMELVGANGQFG